MMLNEPIRLEASGPQEDVKMVDLFTINDKVYQIPSKPKMNVAVRYLWQAKTLGEVPAATNLLVDLIGEEGFQALANYEDLTPEQFTAVVNAAVQVTMGELNKSLGNSASGQSK